MKNVVLGIHDRPSVLKWILLSTQHVFAMFGATILVPLLTGMDVGIALLGSGIGTLIYIALTRARVPMYLGSSFAYIGAIQTFWIDKKFDPNTALTGIIAVGVIYLLISLIIYFFGVKWLRWLLPSVIVGPMIIIIGLGIAPIAINNIINPSISYNVDKSTLYKPLISAFTTLIIIITIAYKAKGFIKIIPFLFGILGGYLMALSLGIVDISLFKNMTFFKLPKFNIIGSYTPSFHALSVFIPLSFVTIMEHIGDHEVLGRVMNRDLLKDPGLASTLAGDGLATLVAGAIGAPANTSYGENTGVVALTRVHSVWVTGLAAVFAIFLSFIQPVNIFIQSIPNSVLGGMSIVLFGLIASNGLKVLQDDKVDMTNLKNLFIVSSMLVIGIGNLSIDLGNNIKIEKMALAAIVGVILHLYFKLLDNIDFKKFKKKNDNKIKFYKSINDL